MCRLPSAASRCALCSSSCAVNVSWFGSEGKRSSTISAVVTSIITLNTFMVFCLITASRCFDPFLEFILWKPALQLYVVGETERELQSNTSQFVLINHDYDDG